MNDALAKESLLDGLTTRRLGKKLFLFDEIDSTNSCARVLAETGADEGTVVLAEYQTAGRGRLGRTWTAASRENLLLSLILRPTSGTPGWTLPYAVSEGVARAVEESLGATVATKWPNDLLVGERKFCGLLVEAGATEAGSYAVAGIGLNVNQTSFPDDLRSKATSLQLSLGRPVDRARLFCALMAHVESTLDLVTTGRAAEVIDAWCRRCTTFGRTVQIDRGNDTVEGTALRLSEDGGLVVTTGSGTTTVHAGDVTMLGSPPSLT